MKETPMVLLVATLVMLPARDVRPQSAVPWLRIERMRTNAPQPTSAEISVQDLRTRLFLFADDSMQGRLLGTEGNVKGTDYIAREARRLGLQPAGDDGGYFQLVPVVERSFDAGARLTIGDQALEAWKDFVPRDQGPGTRRIDGTESIYAGLWGDAASLIPASAAAGKLVVLSVRPDERVQGGVPGLPSRPAVQEYFSGAAGIAVIGLGRLPREVVQSYRQPSQGMRDESAPVRPAYLYITATVARALVGADPATLSKGTVGRIIHGEPRFLETLLQSPARNVVAILPGSDPVLRHEYVAIGAHNDHIGSAGLPVAHDSVYVVNHLFKLQGAESENPRLTPQDVARVNAALAGIRRRTGGASARPDSIFNGADDDGTGSMSVLELAEYFAAQPVRPKRSLLFVWHVGEEEGLYGSGYFTDHPTVPRDAIVAQLNIDMIGRGGADDVTGSTKDGREIHGGPAYVQLIGSRRLSTELGDLVERVNRTKGHKLSLDYTLDADGHPQNIYCRSDHYSYARYGIPIAFFTTGWHADYHELTDEPQYIDYDHMLRVVNLVKDIVWATAGLDHRPVVNKAKPDPRGDCQQ